MFRGLEMVLQSPAGRHGHRAPVRPQATRRAAPCCRILEFRSPHGWERPRSASMATPLPLGVVVSQRPGSMQQARIVVVGESLSMNRVFEVFEQAFGEPAKAR